MTPSFEALTTQIDSIESLLKKYVKVLETVNDAYELEDYTREEWLTRKSKWQKLIEQTKDELYETRKIYSSNQQVTVEEHRENLLHFFENITKMTAADQRNDLYKTVIDSIVYLHNGNTIAVKINFK